MAVTIKEQEETIDLELAKVKTYVHYGYGMTFKEGGIYTFSKADAHELLGLHDEWGVPYFRKYQPPKKKEDVSEDGEPIRSGQGVVSLPDAMKKGNEHLTMEEEPEEAPPTRARKKAKRAPKVVKAVEPEPETQEAADDVDSDEIDTAGGVEV